MRAAGALAVLALLTVVSFLPSTTAATPTLGPWAETTDYGAATGSTGRGGLTVQSQSCVTYQATIYCVAGVVAGAESSKVFYAGVASGGVGGWTETTDYGAVTGSSGSGGTLADGLSCVADGGYVYCVGGSAFNSTANLREYLSKVYYAPLSASGVGGWKETTDYGAAAGSSGEGGLQADPSCVAYGGYVYCVGGDLPTYNSTSKVYYAQLSSAGVGPWTETTDYGASSGSAGSGGIATRPSCVAALGDLVCVGGAVNYKGNSKVFVTASSSNGVGAWTETTDYGATSGSTGAGGVPIYGTSCAANNDSITCVGGYDQPTNAVYQGTPTFGVGVVKYSWATVDRYPYLVYNSNCIWDLEAKLLICAGGNDPTGTTEMDVSGVWYAQVSGASTTSTTSLTSEPPSTSTTAATSQGQSTRSEGQSTTSGSGGIPEFPSAPLLTAALTAMVIVTYLLARSRRQ